MDGRRHDERAEVEATPKPSERASAIPRDVRAILAPLAALVGEFIVGELRPVVGGGGPSDRYYTARTSPLPPKAFLAAARAGSFASFRIGKVVYAVRDDVHRYVEARPRPIRVSVVVEQDDEIGRLLDERGVRRPRGSR
jgi:hypothetical protein